MLSGKLMQTLEVLREEEWSGLLLFLESPIVNSGKEAEAVLALFKFCKKFKEDFQSPEFTKEAAYEEVYPAQKKVKGKLEKLTSRLFKLTQEYIVWKESSSLIESQKELFLAEFYRERNVPKLSEREIKRKQSKLQKSGKMGAEHFWQTYLMNKKFTVFENTFRQNPKVPYLPMAMEALDVFYIIERLEQACWFFAQKMHQHVEEGVSLEWLKKELPMIYNGPYYKVPTVRIYYAALQFLQQPLSSEDEYFFQFEKELNQHGKLLSIVKLKTLQTILRIYAVIKYNQGNEQFLPTAFRLYQEHLEKGWLFHNGKIIPETLMNIVNLGLRYRKGEWVFGMLNKMKNKIWDASPEKKVYSFNLALYYFHEKEYEKSEKLLNDHYQNFNYKIAARRLEIKLLYEQQSILLMSKTEAFKMFIFRLSKNQLPEKLKELNNNFIDFVRQIIHPKTLGNERRINKLKLKMDEREEIAEREWLLEKLNELQ